MTATGPCSMHLTQPEFVFCLETRPPRVQDQSEHVSSHTHGKHSLPLVLPHPSFSQQAACTQTAATGPLHRQLPATGRLQEPAARASTGFSVTALSVRKPLYFIYLTHTLHKIKRHIIQPPSKVRVTSPTRFLLERSTFPRLALRPSDLLEGLPSGHSSPSPGQEEAPRRGLHLLPPL